MAKERGDVGVVADGSCSVDDSMLELENELGMNKFENDMHW